MFELYRVYKKKVYSWKIFPNMEYVVQAVGVLRKLVHAEMSENWILRRFTNSNSILYVITD